MSRFNPTSWRTSAVPYSAIGLVAIALGLAGCGAMTTAPVAPSVVAPAAARGPAVQATAGTRYMAPEDGDGNDSGGIPAGGGTGDAGPSAPVASSDVLTTFNAHHAASGSIVSRSATVGATPVTIVSGRWRLDVPANAFASNVRLTLSASNARGPACALGSQPADPGPCASPLTLSVDTRGAASNRTNDFVLLAYDAASGNWRALPGSKADKRKKTVSAQVTAPGIFGVGYADGTPAW